MRKENHEGNLKVKNEMGIGFRAAALHLLNYAGFQKEAVNVLGSLNKITVQLCLQFLD